MKYAPRAKHRNQEQDQRKLLCAPIQSADSIYALLKVAVSLMLKPNVCPGILEVTKFGNLTRKTEELIACTLTNFVQIDIRFVKSNNK